MSRSRADVERERRERLRRDRERRRAAQSTMRATPVAARERHEGLVGVCARLLRGVPSRSVILGQGFAREVGAVLGIMVRPIAAAGRRGLRGDAPAPGSLTDSSFDSFLIEDPRLLLDPPARPRRADRRSDLTRRRLRAFFVSLAVVVALATWFIVPGLDVFRIRHLEIVGASAMGELDLREQLDPLLEGSTIFTVDDDAIRRKLERMPFVRRAAVERHLFGGLAIHVDEYRPLALGYGDGDYWLVARDGRILARGDREEWTGRVPLVTLNGNHLRPGVRVGDEPALRLLAARQSDSTIAFVEIEASTYSLVGKLADGTEIRFGRDQELHQKLASAEWLMRWTTRHGIAVRRINVTVPSKPTYCARDNVACGMAHGGTAEPDDGTSDAAVTTPEEQGSRPLLGDTATPSTTTAKTT